MQIEGACGWHGVLIPLWTGGAENALTKLTLPYCAGPKPLKMGGLEIGHTPHVETSQGWGPCPCMLAWGLFSVMLLPPPLLLEPGSNCHGFEVDPKNTQNRLQPRAMEAIATSFLNTCSRMHDASFSTFRGGSHD